MEHSPLEGLIVPINKPAGISSFGVISRIRRATGVRKVGHAGTLDPFAEGVLVVGIGRTATRQLGRYLGMEKEYVAGLVLGIVTDTYDCTGEVVQKSECDPPHRGEVERVLSAYRGEIDQVPPPFSAVKVGGIRLYKAARRGIKLQAEPRRVKIHNIELESLRDDGFDIRVVCSHGTYIRSLAHDIGRDLGCGAHLERLVRVRVGDMTLERAESLVGFLERARTVRAAG